MIPSNSINGTITYVVPTTTGSFTIGDGLTSNNVYISKEELEELQADSKLLYALIDEGVEEWEGYDRAILNI